PLAHRFAQGRKKKSWRFDPLPPTTRCPLFTRGSRRQDFSVALAERAPLWGARSQKSVINFPVIRPLAHRFAQGRKKKSWRLDPLPPTTRCPLFTRGSRRQDFSVALAERAPLWGARSQKSVINFPVIRPLA